MTQLIKRIDAYSLVELLEQVQENIQAGYVIDLSTNENYPQIIGHHYTLGMVKMEVEDTSVAKVRKSKVQ